jgi:hypothetical protein
MDQRRLRPGDSLDDYCPRERRLTDHVIVAVVDDVVKQTRCVACDTEHPFKDGKVPARRKKKETPAVLVQQVIEGLGEAGVVPADDNGHGSEMQPNLVMRPERKPSSRSKRGPTAVADPAAPPAAAAPSLVPPAPPQVPPPPVTAAPADESEPPGGAEDEGPVHRRLIRATLPRPEGQPPGRPLPDFTIRQPGSRPAFSRGPQSARTGHKGASRFGGPWNGKNGHGGPRHGASAQGSGGDPRGHYKNRSRSGRPHPKKSR